MGRYGKNHETTLRLANRLNSSDRRDFFIAIAPTDNRSSFEHYLLTAGTYRDSDRSIKTISGPITIQITGFMPLSGKPDQESSGPDSVTFESLVVR
jgi:hypothetical protein